MGHGQPIQLLCKLGGTQTPVPLSLDLELKQAGFGGVQEIESIGCMSDRFMVWKNVQYNERIDNSSISTESFLFNRLAGELTTGFVSTDQPMNGMLGKSLHYNYRKDEKLLWVQDLPNYSIMSAQWEELLR